MGSEILNLNMNITFNRATEKDIPTIAALANKIWNEHYISIISQQQIDYMLHEMYSSESLLQQMTEGHKFTLALIDNIAAGYISLSTRDHQNYYVNKFYVDVFEHRKGVGSGLFNHVLKQLPSAKTFELAVNRENYKAINFYFKLGFVIKHTIDLDIGGGFFMNDFLMVKVV